MTAPVKVQIFGQPYSIRGELDETYVQKLAAYVDRKMRDISDAGATVDTQKVAVLAALAIAVLNTSLGLISSPNSRGPARFFSASEA